MCTDKKTQTRAGKKMDWSKLAKFVSILMSKVISSLSNMNKNLTGLGDQID